MENAIKIFVISLVFFALKQYSFAQKTFYFGPDVTVNVNDSVVIRLNDYQGDIQWQKSPDLVSWESIAAATLDTLLFIADITTYFRAEVIAGNCDPFYSDTTMVGVFDNNGQPGEGVTDIDGNFYPSVIIGNQEWMAENLRVTRDANGNDIARYCYNNDAVNCDLYGGLYTWHTVMNGATSSNTNPDNVQGICPTGWHMPSDAEWTELVDYVVAQGYPNDWGNPKGAGNALKSCRQVSSPLGGDCATSGHPRWNSHSTHYGTNEFGFSALPGGIRDTNGYPNYLGNIGHWWSHVESSTTAAWNWRLEGNVGNVSRYSSDKGFGFSVRCVRGN